MTRKRNICMKISEDICIDLNLTSSRYDPDIDTDIHKDVQRKINLCMA